jgi:DNA polymerase III subunit chi
MTRIDFYFNVADKQQVVVSLVEAAVAKRRQVTIAAADESSAANVSKNLWQHSPESFLPNVLANHAAAAQTPVVIHWQENALHQDELLINLTPNQPTFFSRFTHLVELVSDDEQDKISARARFKFYRDRGYEIKSIDYAQVKIE